MSNTNPNDPNAPFNDPDALTRGDVQGDPAGAEQRQQEQQRRVQASQAQREQKAAQDREEKLSRYNELQREYLELKEKVAKAAASRTTLPDPVAADHARKGDVVREMDKLKGELGLP